MPIPALETTMGGGVGAGLGCGAAKSLQWKGEMQKEVVMDCEPIWITHCVTVDEALAHTTGVLPSMHASPGSG